MRLNRSLILRRLRWRAQRERRRRKEREREREGEEGRTSSTAFAVGSGGAHLLEERAGVREQRHGATCF